MQKADMPTPRWNFTTCEIQGTIYAIGGSSSEDTVSPTPWAVEAYDTATDTWTRKGDIPASMGANHASVVNGKIYTVGGGGGSMVYMYDPATDTWTRRADMLTPRRFVATSTVNGKIYAIGGTTPGNYSALSTVEEYDPAADTWAKKADMLSGRWALCTSVVNKKIYAIGGRPDLRARPDVQEYDPATDTWKRKSNMLVATSQMDSVVSGNKIIVIGGWLWSADFPYTTVQIYDPETDIWERAADAPFLRAAFSAEVVNNRIYVIGGTDRPHPCPATPTVYELTINPPPPDFNGDGIIDATDMCIMVDNWGTDDSLCDVAPPLGDGIVDVEDLKVLVEHLFEDVNDPTLIGHWPLDEAQGNIAYDDASDHDGVLIGGPTWQADSGIVDGALQFDGIDDYVSTDFVLKPADGPFSVLAWVNGGAAGQAIISEPAGSDWLSLHPLTGHLMTELASAGRGAGFLLSETAIDDGNWHRIGLVWDGLHRTLFVDGVAVAEDTQNGLASPATGFYIGCGKNMQPGTHFSGLIDDVRIYNRVVSP
jgi:N-acetylneuraminic acid mutarotase